MRNNIIKVVRHAVAIDERRCFYRQNLWGEPYEDQDVKQVWFAGSHSDVGGSFEERECGLSQIALEWMVEEALKEGLLVDSNQYRTVVPHEVIDNDGVDFHAPPDFKGKLHKSLRGIWWIPEYFPKLYADRYDEHRRKLKIPGGKRRYI